MMATPKMTPVKEKFENGNKQEFPLTKGTPTVKGTKRKHDTSSQTGDETEVNSTSDSEISFPQLQKVIIDLLILTVTRLL